MSEGDEDLSIYGTVKVGDRGQVVIPSKARRDFDIKPGDLLLVVAGRNRRGIAMVKADVMREFAARVLKGLEETIEKIHGLGGIAVVPHPYGKYLFRKCVGDDAVNIIGPDEAAEGRHLIKLVALGGELDDGGFDNLRYFFCFFSHGFPFSKCHPSLRSG